MVFEQMQEAIKKSGKAKWLCAYEIGISPPSLYAILKGEPVFEKKPHIRSRIERWIKKQLNS